jgi:hypothetical protein
MVKKYQQLSWKNISRFPEKISADFLKKYQQLS